MGYMGIFLQYTQSHKFYLLKGVYLSWGCRGLYRGYVGAILYGYIGAIYMGLYIDVI